MHTHAHSHTRKPTALQLRAAKMVRRDQVHLKPSSVSSPLAKKAEKELPETRQLKIRSGPTGRPWRAGPSLGAGSQLAWTGARSQLCCCVTLHRYLSPSESFIIAGGGINGKGRACTVTRVLPSQQGSLCGPGLGLSHPSPASPEPAPRASPHPRAPTERSGSAEPTRRASLPQNQPRAFRAQWAPPAPETLAPQAPPPRRGNPGPNLLVCSQWK